MTELCDCTTNCSQLISRRYVLGPSDTNWFLVFESFPEDPDPRKFAIRCLELKDVTISLLSDRNSTVYKVPAGSTAIVRVDELATGGFILDVEHLQIAPTVGRPGQIGECTGSCPPYTRKCTPPNTPVCVNGQLICVPPGAVAAPCPSSAKEG
jgi:hypothetical protein